GEEFHEEHLRRLHLPTLKTLVLDSAPVSAAALAQWQASAADVYRSQRRAIEALRAMNVDVMTERGDARRDIPAVVPDEFFVEACRVGGTSPPNMAIMRRLNVPTSPPVAAARGPSGKQWAPLRHLHTLRWLTLMDASMDDDAVAYVQDLGDLESLRLTS